MELRRDEELLIEALREMREPAANILLWFQVGQEGSLAKAEDPDWSYWDGTKRNIELAGKYMKLMSMNK